VAYGSDQGLTDWLDANGYVLPDGAPSAAVLRQRGSSYLDGAYDGMWSGARTDGVMQEDGWPRVGASLNCISAIPSDAIPAAVVNASYRAAWLEAQTPGVLAGTPPTQGKRVKRQKVEGIEREFFDDGKAAIGAGPGFVDSIIDGMMQPFICDADKGAAFMWSLGC
jgi:hypothetical protein